MSSDYTPPVSSGGGGGGIPQGGPLTQDLALDGNKLLVSALGDPLVWQGSNALIGTDTGGPYLQSIMGDQLRFDPSDGSLIFAGLRFFTPFGQLIGFGDSILLASFGENTLSTILGQVLFDLSDITNDGSGNLTSSSFTGDVSNSTVSGNVLGGLFDGTGEINLLSIVATGIIAPFVTCPTNVETPLIIDHLGSFASSLDINNRIAYASNGVTAVVSWASVSAFATSIKSALVDTGWTANADAGDKTVSIGSTASLTTIATALNVVSAGAGTALLNIAQKVKALESALAGGLIPNN